MGKTSKFTFPIPGKKQKPGIGPIVSGPMSKAQKILGTAELNIDAPQWDDMSNSGISISISESTATTSYYTNDRALQTVGEEEEYVGKGRSNARWELESETVPAYLRSGRNSRLPDGDGTIRDLMSETSSLRRRQSNSTLRSWYDKAKMPLSISQQTSASAMAKGLPSKASALLDADTHGNVSSTASTTSKSKRPSRLDLSHLMPGRHRRESQYGESSPRSTLGHDYVTKSPSTTSISPATPSPDQQRHTKRLLRKPTKERLAETVVAQRPTTGSSSQRSVPGHGLNSPRDLYDHYEQATFRQFMESPEGEEEKMDIPDFPQAPVGPTPLKSPSHPRNNVANPIIQEPLTAAPGLHGANSSAEVQCARAFSSVPQASVADNDYASSFASVSSRHTKTSKASKHTNQSLADSDRQERSVLSLSSDSEEDDSLVETASRSTQSVSSFGRASRDTPTSPTTTSRKSIASRGESVASGSEKKTGKRASFALTPTYLTIPTSTPAAKPTSVNLRTSSLHRGNLQQQQQHLQRSPSSRASSRISTMSASTTNSDWQAQTGFEVKEAKAVMVRPVASTSQSLASEPRSSPEGKLSGRKTSMRSGEQPTPPLSPTSLDFCVEPESSIDASSSQNPRLMAVTRQEQMLLAALRSKRAMMRETLMAEFEGESQQAHGYGHKHTSSQATIKGSAYPEPTQTLRHQGSGTSTGTIKLDSRGSDRKRESSNSSKQHGYRQRSSGGTATRSSSSRSGSAPASKASSLKKARFAGDSPPSANDEGRHERVLLYLDRPKRNVTSMDLAEPSPDLSDFMDFDGISDEEDEKTGEDYLYSHESRNRVEAGRLSASRASSQRRRAGEASRPSSSSAPSKSKSPLSRSERASMVGDVEENMEERQIMSAAALDVPEMGRKKAARLSAVGRAGPEVGWWGDDG
ncbi:conserved hypothetical protein [Verticillium alfalfae VaMs.102]|uniref:Uncharacterized protein n=1 Tax=Verticillium alfalfae (strain VaMs.102 / ATCC MYA-4576 / FGSC 10136) TaxID=526221 RepID=C9SYT5_VERA1|nr:conserved hypothetical protein [Verticillium alfalfae VaMs.102]EEY23950.1 conserved hypothetical protein [Verticillium alfalfae VaMs.102]